ncbi:MAG: hypothetical protein ACRDJN_21635 [Chloroflexota bacterium]
MKRVVLLLATSLAVLLTPATPGFAEETWCEVDPPVVIETPAGNQVTVYVLNAGPVEHAVQLITPTITYTTKPVQDGTATAVTMRVRIADVDGHGHHVRSRVWSGPAPQGLQSLRSLQSAQESAQGRVYSERPGKAGSDIWHEFVIDVP